MITLPEQMTAVPKYPGYFWHVDEEQLYSIKVDGVLKPLKKQYSLGYFKGMNQQHHAALWASFDEYFYRISHKGKRKFLGDRYLKRLPLRDGQIPIREEMTETAG